MKYPKIKTYTNNTINGKEFVVRMVKGVGYAWMTVGVFENQKYARLFVKALRKESE